MPSLRVARIQKQRNHFASSAKEFISVLGSQKEESRLQGEGGEEKRVLLYSPSKDATLALHSHGAGERFFGLQVLLHPNCSHLASRS